MKRPLLLSCFILACSLAFAQSPDAAAIQKVMDDQADAWNRGSIDDFMKGYWHSDSLMFVGKSGISYGYTKVLENYKKGYSDTAKMGKLAFTTLNIKRLSADHFILIGKWHLTRSVGDIGGIYSLLFRKVDGHWVIIVDHTS